MARPQQDDSKGPRSSAWEGGIMKRFIALIVLSVLMAAIPFGCELRGYGDRRA